MKGSGIYVTVDQARKIVNQSRLARRRYYWREYLRFCRWCRNKPTFWLKRKPSWKTYLRRKDAETEGFMGGWTKKKYCQFWGNNGEVIDICNALEKACKVPPADDKIFISLNDLEYLKI